MTQPPQPHKALLTVTGWHTRRNGRVYLDGIWIGPPPAKMHGQRLTATFFPKTDTQGTLAGWLRWSSIYPAKRRPNDQQFEIVARLIRVDVASNQLSLYALRLIPAQRPPVEEGVTGQ